MKFIFRLDRNICKDRLMERLQSVQSSTDCTADPASPQPENLNPTNEIPSNIEEMHDLQRVYSRKPTYNEN
jgi:hypothetical protein